MLIHELDVSIQPGCSNQLATSPRLPASSVPAGLDLGGFRDIMAFTYFFDRYTWAIFWKPLIHVGHENKNTVEYKSSLALVCGYFGLQNCDKGTEVIGLRLQQDLINHMKSVLNRGNKDELANMSTAAMILGMFTVSSWIQCKIYERRLTPESMLLIEDSICSPIWASRRFYNTADRTILGVRLLSTLLGHVVVFWYASL